MRLTTRGRYAVTALLDLALQEAQQDTAVSLSDIAKRQSISISYLEQLFSKLRKQGFVVSTRGAAGGYHLATPLLPLLTSRLMPCCVKVKATAKVGQCA